MNDDVLRIDAGDGEQVAEWARRLDASPTQVVDAVRAVGDSAADVELYLKGSRASTEAEEQARAAGGSSVDAGR